MCAEITALLNDRFSVLPGVGFFDEQSDDRANAEASKVVCLGHPDGTVFFGIRLMKLELERVKPIASFGPTPLPLLFSSLPHARRCIARIPQSRFDRAQVIARPSSYPQPTSSRRVGLRSEVGVPLVDPAIQKML
jgi:hypothetical protein